MINNVIDKLRIYLFPPVMRRDALQIAASAFSFSVTAPGQENIIFGRAASLRSGKDKAGSRPLPVFQLGPRQQAGGLPGV